jgi:uncharacterized protein (TIGR02996 family)
MTTPDDAFLRAIVARPDDDTPRLVYADWLEEHGDADRAEFIRGQCELERLKAEGRRNLALGRRVRELLAAHADRWTEPLRAAKLRGDWHFRRGFVEGVTMSATRFVRNAAKLFRLAPTVRSARFPDASNEVTALARCKYLARLTELDLRRMCDCGACPIDRELADLFASPHAVNLVSLNVAEDRIGEDLARLLAATKRLASLTALDLSGNPFGPDGVRALVESRHLMTRLATLDLSRCGLGNDGAKFLAGEPRLAGLKTLALRGNAIGNTGGKALASSPHAAGLTVLDLRNNRIGAEAVEALRARFGKRVKL